MSKDFKEPARRFELVYAEFQRQSAVAGLPSGTELIRV